MRDRGRKGPKLPPGVSLGGRFPGAPQSGAPEAPSSRPAQVASVVQRAIQERIIRGLSDPRFQGMVSVQEVRMKSDLSIATVCVSVLPVERAKLTLSAMRSAAGFFRSHLRESTRLRSVPQIEFELSDPPSPPDEETP